MRPSAWGISLTYCTEAGGTYRHGLWHEFLSLHYLSYWSTRTPISNERVKAKYDFRLISYGCRLKLAGRISTMLMQSWAKSAIVWNTYINNDDPLFSIILACWWISSSSQNDSILRNTSFFLRMYMMNYLLFLFISTLLVSARPQTVAQTHPDMSHLSPGDCLVASGYLSLYCLGGAADQRGKPNDDTAQYIANYYGSGWWTTKASCRYCVFPHLGIF